jgi:hypothetical protein
MIRLLEINNTNDIPWNHEETTVVDDDGEDLVGAASWLSGPVTVPGSVTDAQDPTLGHPELDVLGLQVLLMRFRDKRDGFRCTSAYPTSIFTSLCS